MEDLVVKRAKEWAESTWAGAVVSWLERSSQDYEYRQHVVEPALSEIIDNLDIDRSSSVVEIGCGDGSHSIFWRNKLNDLGLKSVKIFGFDILETSISKAKEKASGHQNITFEIADVTSENIVNLIRNKVGTPDVLVAMFLFQDIPDLDGVLGIVNSCLNHRGHFITVFVHPDFARHLFEAHYIKRYEENNFPHEHIAETGVVQWRFVGSYPIVRQGSFPFYLPYFHRNLDDYYNALTKHKLNIQHKQPLKLKQSLAEKLKEEKISPFYKNKHNVYWPLIVKEPSSMLIHAIKK